ncbi:major capsid protein [Sulfitobacter sp. 1A15106]|uniref:major capsid protein n=1 Tax=Sulfitobacter sp. 1A15106 TaxID=3368590 RepID=UPI003745E7DF
MDRFSTVTLLSMIEEVEVKRSFWTGLAFSNTVFFDTDTIEFDMKHGGKPVAPFVSPLVGAPTLRRQGFITKSMKAAYIKLKSAVAPTDALIRTAGEGYNNQQMSPQQRMDMLMAQELGRHDEMVTNRIEWMAAKTIIDGQYVVEGEEYQRTLVDFGHPASLKVALAGAAVWSAATASPIDDIEDMAQRIRVESKGAVADTVVMHTTAWQMIRKHPDFKDRLNKDFADARINKSSIDDGIMTDPIGLNYVGRLDSKLDLYVYDDYLTDDDGNDVPLMPDNTVVVMARAAMEGAQYYGAILDEGFQSVRMFSKSRTSWDPYGEELLSQSAPLVAPRRVNTWGTINVA